MAEKIEYLWVEQNLLKEPCRILCLGSRNDKAVEQFTQKGYTVVGIDLLPDTREIEKYEFCQGDFCEMLFDEKFYCIYAISTIEHIGLQCYGQNSQDDEGDIKAVEKLFDLLTPGGVLLITLPYGRFTQPRDGSWRVYDRTRLEKIVHNYEHHITFFLATTEIFISGWRLIHSSDPPPEIISVVWDYAPIIKLKQAETFCSLACVKIEK